MAKTKISIRKKRRILHIASISLCVLSFLFVLFESVVAFHGGWDDLNYDVICVTPIVALVSLVIALFNEIKYHAKGREIGATLTAVALSSLFFCFMMVYTSAVTLARV